MHHEYRGPLRGYAVAVLAVAGALLARFLLDAFLGDHLPFVTFFLAVVVAACYGLRPGLAATVLSFFLAWYFFVPTRLTFAGASGPHLVGLAMYLVVSLAIAGLGGVMREAQRGSARDQQAAEEQRQRAAALSDDLRKRVEELDALLRVLPVGIFVAHDPACAHVTTNPAGADPGAHARPRLRNVHAGGPVAGAVARRSGHRPDHRQAAGRDAWRRRRGPERGPGARERVHRPATRGDVGQCGSLAPIGTGGQSAPELDTASCWPTTTATAQTAWR